MITQQKFSLELLSEFNCLDSWPVSTPLNLTLKLSGTCGTPLPDPLIYRCLLGKLNFLANTCPNLSFTVYTLSQYMQSPCSGHLNAAFHTLRYLSRDTGLGLFMSSESSYQILAYCDSDWAACSDTRQSISDFFLSLGGSPISWKSKK